MKKIALSLLAVLGFSAVTHADGLAGPLWTCSLKADHVQGMNIGLGLSIGGLETDDARITCEQVGGRPVTTRVALRISQIGIGLGLSFSHSFVIDSLIVGLASTNDLFGNHKIGAVAAANIINHEYGVTIMSRLNGGASIELGILRSRRTNGLGVRLQGMYLEILSLRQYAQMQREREADLDRIRRGNNFN